MSMYPHRNIQGAPPSNGSRLHELLEQIRIEFESQASQYQTCQQERKLWIELWA